MLEIALIFSGILVTSIVFACIQANKITDEDIIAELVKDSCFVNSISDNTKNISLGKSVSK